MIQFTGFPNAFNKSALFFESHFVRFVLISTTEGPVEEDQFGLFLA